MKIKKSIAISAIVLAVCCISTALIISTSTGTASTENDKNTEYFYDIANDDWFYEDVKYVKEKELMQGTEDGVFSPYAKTTRAMIVTILWRLEGSPTGYNNEFSDVTKNDYFLNAVAWAAKKGIVSGYDANLFAPNDNATREQLAAIIYRYASFKNYDLSKSAALIAYSDRVSVSEYAIKPFEWAVANKIISGTSDNTLSPGDYVQRSQVAAILHRFCIQFKNDKTTDKKETNKTDNAATTPPTTGKSDTGKNNDSSINTPETKEKVSDEFSLSVNDVISSPGNRIKVTARVDNNPGILGMTLSIYFDDKNLTLLNVENGSAFKGVLDMTPSKEFESGARVLWDGIDLKDDDIHDGEILIMDFKVSDSAPIGTYPISLKYFDDDIVDKNLKSISPEISNGHIIVSD